MKGREDEGQREGMGTFDDTENAGSEQTSIGSCNSNRLKYGGRIVINGVDAWNFELVYSFKGTWSFEALTYLMYSARKRESIRGRIYMLPYGH
jgi:hypothetical protein